MAENVYNILFWIITLSFGESIASETGNIIIEPNEQKIIENTHICYFKNKIECNWKRKDGTRTTASSSGFTYVNGNGSKTCDCSIKFNQQLNCSGIYHKELQSFKLVSVRHIMLRCISNDKGNCSWQLNNTEMRIDGHRIKYTKNDNGINVTDCSITIDTDQLENYLGKWECAIVSYYGTCVHEVYYASTEHNFKNSITESTSIQTSLPTIKQQTTSVPSIKEEISRANEPTLSYGIIIAILIAIVTLIAVNIAVVMFVMKYVKRQQMLSVNDSSNRALPNTQESAPPLVRYTTPLTTNQMSYNSGVIPSAGNKLHRTEDDDGYLIPVQVPQLSKFKNKRRIRNQKKNRVSEHLYMEIF